MGEITSLNRVNINFRLYKQPHILILQDIMSRNVTSDLAHGMGLTAA